MRLPIAIAAALMTLFLALCPPAYADPDTQEESQTKPNILLILTDNTGWGDWGVYGGGSLRGAPSPHI
jgi:arylsulfatase